MEDLRLLKDENTRLKAEIERLRRENAVLRGARSEKEQSAVRLTPDEKIDLFCSVFRGRQDIVALRWESRNGTSGYSPAHFHDVDPSICRRPKRLCNDLGPKRFVPFDRAITHQHLTGRVIAGVYPLLSDDTCWFLAVDFDKSTWMRDANRFRTGCHAAGVPCYVERSRSGNGAHAWIFFAEPVSAREARALGTLLLSYSAVNQYPIDFKSFDRFFPNQDVLPRGGYGNLIALPLQRGPRNAGNSVFIDEGGIPYPDQWALLASVRKVSSDSLTEIISRIPRPLDRALTPSTGAFDDVPEARSDPTPCRGPYADNQSQTRPRGQLPFGDDPTDTTSFSNPTEPVKAIRANLFYIAKTGLSNRLQAQLSAIAAFANPEFYKAQKQRRPVWNKPRVIACSEDFPDHIGLPRGCEDDALQLLGSVGADVAIEDHRTPGEELLVAFAGRLSREQSEAVATMLAHDCGVLCAPTGFGKTVAAASIIAARRRNTLILVHRKRLAQQWRDRLREFLDLPGENVAVVGRDKTRASGIVDVALFQSLFRDGVVHDLVTRYGHLIVDECHHVSAFSFEQVLRRAGATYVLGLTATPIRQDGRHPIIQMQCGPIRHRVDERAEALRHRFTHNLILRETSLAVDSSREKAIYEIYTELVNDRARNSLIASDVLTAIQEGRTPLVLSERKLHLELLREQLEPHVETCAVLVGGIGKKRTSQALQALDDAGSSVLLATGRLVGEGFDHPRLDTLFLTFPVSWKGIVQQYVGRLHRHHSDKKEVRVYDYADLRVPVLAASFRRRLKSYQRMGYEQNWTE